MIERPNIILITTDQQRGDCLGIDGHPVLQTPNLDWIASTGVRFTSAYSECPSCVPARRSLMTGTAPAAHGMVGMQSDDEWNPRETLARVLTESGYQTEMIGKSHLGRRDIRFGFEHIQLSNNSNTGVYAEWLQRRGYMESNAGYGHGVASNAWVGRPHYLPENMMHSYWCFDRALEFLTQRDQSCPFFLNISLIDPHPPLTPPQFYYDRYIQRELPEPVVGDWAPAFDGPQRGLNPNAWEISLDPEQMRCSRAAYYGLVNFVDDQIGRLLQTARTILDKTILVFTSDHGEMLGDHNMFRKTVAYEASARIPYLVRFPSSLGLGNGMVSDAVVGLQDIMPTILDAVDVSIPETVTGKSLLPITGGKSDSVREYLHGEHEGHYDHHKYCMQYLTDGKWKYIWYTQTGREQLFNLQKDPQETHDLSSEADGEISKWRKRMMEVLAGRPEGFTDGKKLITGRPHKRILPGYKPDKFYPYL